MENMSIQKNIKLDTASILKNIDTLSEKVKKEMREADARNIKSMKVASEFIANI